MIMTYLNVLSSYQVIQAKCGGKCGHCEPDDPLVLAFNTNLGWYSIYI